MTECNRFVVRKLVFIHQVSHDHFSDGAGGEWAEEWMDDTKEVAVFCTNCSGGMYGCFYFERSALLVAGGWT